MTNGIIQKKTKKEKQVLIARNRKGTLYVCDFVYCDYFLNETKNNVVRALFLPLTSPW